MLEAEIETAAEYGENQETCKNRPVEAWAKANLTNNSVECEASRAAQSVPFKFVNLQKIDLSKV